MCHTRDSKCQSLKCPFQVRINGQLQACTRPGDRILDPFAESGTTAVVAQAQPMFDEVPDPLAIHDPLTKSNR